LKISSNLLTDLFSSLGDRAGASGGNLLADLAGLF
jgi:hypothetical protein